MDAIVEMLGLKGILGVIGFLVFAYAFKYSHNIFSWVENQTIGTRTYIMERLDLLFIEIPEEKLTTWLLFLSLGLSGASFLIFALFGKWILG